MTDFPTPRLSEIEAAWELARENGDNPSLLVEYERGLVDAFDARAGEDAADGEARC